MQHFLRLFLGILILASFSCRKKDKLDVKDAMIYYPNQCANPWNRSSLFSQDANEDFKLRIKNWLQFTTGVTITHIEYILTNKNGILCHACQCASGYTLYIWPSHSQDSEQKLLDLGYHKP